MALPHPPPTVPVATTVPARRTGPQPALRVDSLRKQFRDIQALRGVSFQLRRGERLALLGPNGAGKTTLIRCIAGRTKPDAGEIEMLGKPLPATGGRESMGLVPQDFAIYNDLSTRENLIAFARFHGLRGNALREQVEWALQWTGLADRQHDLVGGFSGGMRRRVNLACGVMHRPKLILLDEPTVGVDPQSRERIFQMLDELHSDGAAILLTTHHLEEAEQRCDRIVIIDGGTVIADGTFNSLVDITIGNARHVHLRLDQPLSHPLEQWQFTATALGHVLETRIDDVATQVPHLLEAVRASGRNVVQFDVRAPSLHDVFLHLTGRELRD